RQAVRKGQVPKPCEGSVRDNRAGTGQPGCAKVRLSYSSRKALNGSFIARTLPPPQHQFRLVAVGISRDGTSETEQVVISILFLKIYCKSELKLLIINNIIEATIPLDILG